MKTFIMKAGTPMTAAKNSTFNRNRLSNLSIGALLLFCLSMPGALLMGQNPTPIDLTEFEHGVNQIGVSGDTLKFEFWLGTEAHPAEEVVGFEIEVGISGLSPYPPQAFARMGNSWVSAGAANQGMDNNYNSSIGKLVFQYLREDKVGQTGYGAIATICLVRPGGWPDPQSVELNIGGGLVMVDNSDFKRIPAADEQGFGMLAWPNPAQDQLTVKVEVPMGAELLLTDLQGNVVMRLRCEAMQTLDVSALRPGMYLLVVQSEGRQECQRVTVA